MTFALICEMWHLGKTYHSSPRASQTKIQVKSKFYFLNQNNANVILKHFQLNGLVWDFCLQAQNFTWCLCYSLWFWMELHSSSEQRTLSIRATRGTTWHVQFPGLWKRVRVAGPMGKVAWLWRQGVARGASVGVDKGGGGVGEFSLQLEEFRGCLQGVLRVSLLEGIPVNYEDPEVR